MFGGTPLRKGRHVMTPVRSLSVGERNFPTFRLSPWTARPYTPTARASPVSPRSCRLTRPCAPRGTVLSTSRRCGMPPELIVWLVLGFLALVALHELTHVLIAAPRSPDRLRRHQPGRRRGGLRGLARARYWLLQVILPAIVSWLVCYVWLYGVFTYPAPFQARINQAELLGQLPWIVTLLTAADQRRRHHQRHRRGQQAGPRARSHPPRFRGAAEDAGPGAVHRARPQALARDLAGRQGWLPPPDRRSSLTPSAHAHMLTPTADLASRARVRTAAGALRRLFSRRRPAC